MLKLIIKGKEQYDEKKGEFITISDQTLQLEHSLVSLSKWESKWKKPFLSKNERTVEELLDYIRCMTITQNVNPNVYFNLSQKQIEEVLNYINDPMTATTINDRDGRTSSDIITAEIIYQSMIVLNIPFECQKWHLNRLLTLIKVCEIKSRPKKKIRGREVLRSNAALNAARRKKMGSRG